MPNSFFQFKQFRIEQDKCAMKVCTDSCIFGAYVKIDIETKTILDIGAGTGLLTLMLAQKSPSVHIDAIEIDHAAAEQAESNVNLSLWKDRVKVYEKKVQDFFPGIQYDVIVSNPPFFSNSLKSPEEKINLAHHGASLSLDELLDSVLRLLKPQGKLWILLPPHEAEVFVRKAEKFNLMVKERAVVRDRENSEIIRHILQMAYSSSEKYKENEVIIKNQQGQYTNQFISLLKDYYLHLS